MLYRIVFYYIILYYIIYNTWWSRTKGAEPRLNFSTGNVWCWKKTRKLLSWRHHQARNFVPTRTLVKLTIKAMSIVMVMMIGLPI